MAGQKPHLTSFKCVVHASLERMDLKMTNLFNCFDLCMYFFLFSLVLFFMNKLCCLRSRAVKLAEKLNSNFVKKKNTLFELYSNLQGLNSVRGKKLLASLLRPQEGGSSKILPY